MLLPDFNLVSEEHNDVHVCGFYVPIVDLRCVFNLAHVFWGTFVVMFQACLSVWSVSSTKAVFTLNYLSKQLS